jgi:hypothetical protein
VSAVVDTNVAVVANGNSAQASPTCVWTCTVRLHELTENGRLVIDDRWLILKEYMANLRSSGQPGNGDAFLKWVLTNYTNPDRCELVTITPTNEERTNFNEFPVTPGLADFHDEDRKFVAVTMAHPAHPPILQAVDTEWWNLRDQLTEAGVTVEFLCPDDIRAISERARD